MSDFPHGRETHPTPFGGTAIHVGDCYVWAVIEYLDSPTDYREYLPSKNRQTSPAGEKMVMSDATQHHSLSTLVVIAIFALIGYILLSCLSRVWEF